MRGERTTPYKEDSTKGQSMINPLNYKGDVLVQVWVDSRVLATLCGWLDDHGTYPIHLSQVVRRPLEVLTDVLVNGGDARLVDSTIEARDMLQRRFRVDLNRGGRGTKNAMHNVELTIRREDLNESIESERRVHDVSKPLRDRINPATEDIIAEYYRRYPNAAPGQGSNQFKINRDEVYDDSKPVTRGTENKIVEERIAEPLKERSTSMELAERMRKNEETAKAELDALNNLDPSTLMSTARKE